MTKRNYENSSVKRRKVVRTKGMKKMGRPPSTRPKRSGKRIGVSPTQDVREELERISVEMDHSVADVVYRLMLRGLDLYRHDRSLASPRSLPYIDNDKPNEDK